MLSELSLRTVLSSWHLAEVRKSVMEEGVKSEEAAGRYAHGS